MDVAVLGLAAEEAEKAAHQRRHRVGIDRRERTAHALRAAGCARRVVHHLAGGALGGHVARVAGLEFGVWPETGHASDGEAGVLGEGEFFGCRGAGRSETLVSDESLGLAIAHDVGDLGRREMVIDRREEETGLGCGEIQLDHFGAVGKHRREAIALFHAERAQARHRLVAAGEQLAARPLAAIGIDERQLLRIAARKVPETEVGHEGLLRRGCAVLGARLVWDAQ